MFTTLAGSAVCVPLEPFWATIEVNIFLPKFLFFVGASLGVLALGVCSTEGYLFWPVFMAAHVVDDCGSDNC